MRRLIMACAVVWLVVLAGCGPSFSWNVAGTWRIRQLDPVRDSADLADLGISRDQANRYQVMVYSFTVTNQGRSKAEWVGVKPTLHPAFEARIRGRFDFKDHPPLMLRPGGAGTVGATYFLEGTEAEVVALAEQNRFQLSWRHNEQEMRLDVNPTREQNLR